jgi:beta-galactosidase
LKPSKASEKTRRFNAFSHEACFQLEFAPSKVERKAEMRTVIKFNDDWTFFGPDNRPRAVTVPHTWNALDGQDGGNDYCRGRYEYRKTFETPVLAEGQQVYLEFRGVNASAEVRFNGTVVSAHNGGYSTFRIEITPYLCFGAPNALSVFADNSANECVYPQKADFTFYGGIYRDVYLIIVPKSHFSLRYFGGSGLYVTPKLSGAHAVVALQAFTENTPDGLEIQFSVDKVGAVTSFVRDNKAEAEITINNVRLWDGLNDPFLYTAQAWLTDSRDKVTTHFGCRGFAFDTEKGFFLNGRSYPLRGVARHQDRMGVGNAITREMQEEDMEFIKEIGANTVRLAHYQHDQYFYDLCDKTGMIVWTEIPYITQHMDGGRENTLTQMRELVVQNYNHPSIVCWGLSNEITAAGPVTQGMRDNHRALSDMCHALDKTRPTAMAHVFMLETHSPLIGMADIGSYNLYFGWYLGELSQNDSFFDEFHGKFPDKIIGFSEYGADGNPALQSANPERGDYSETYQCVYHEHLLQCINERQYLWASHVWNMFDFAADGRDEGGKHGINQKGLVTFDRKMKKDAFYFYKAAWSKEPFIHLCGRRYIDRHERETEIKVYSNLPEAALYVDGVLLDTKASNLVFIFRVPISGEHVIKAVASGFSDEILIRKVKAANTAYQLAQGGGIINWFDQEGLNKDFFSLKDTLGELAQNPKSADLVDGLMAGLRAKRGDVAKVAAGNESMRKMMASMSLLSVLKQAGDTVKPEDISRLNSALQKIKKVQGDS